MALLAFTKKVAVRVVLGARYETHGRTRHLAANGVSAGRSLHSRLNATLVLSLSLLWTVPFHEAPVLTWKSVESRIAVHVVDRSSDALWVEEKDFSSASRPDLWNFRFLFVIRLERVDA